MVVLFPGRSYYTFATAIEYFSFIVAIMISFFAFKSFRITKDRKHLYFGLGFILIALNLLAGATWNLLQSLNILSTFVNSLPKAISGLIAFAYSASIIAVLIAYIAFIVVYLKFRDGESKILFFTLTLIIGILTFINYPIFNLVAALLVGFIIYHTSKPWLKKKNKNSLTVSLGFLSILVYHLLFALQYITRTVYNVKFAFLLVGFILLLTVFIKVSSHGGKKK